MSIQEKLVKMLFDRGMFPDEATRIIDQLKALPQSEAMQGRWDDQSDGYPSAIITVLWLTTKRLALAHIDEKRPLAWYRPLFAE